MATRVYFSVSRVSGATGAVESALESISNGRVLARIIRDAAGVAEVSVTGLRTTHKKVITEQVQEIDITDMLCDAEITMPIWGNDGVTVGIDNSSIVPNVTIAGTTYRADFAYAPHSNVASRVGRLSDLKALTLTPSSYVAIAMGGVGKNAHIQAGQYYGSKGTTEIDYIAVDSYADNGNSFDLHEDSTEIRFPFSPGNGVYNYPEYSDDLIRIPVKMKPKALNSMQLVWINRYGVPDTWVFDFLREERVEVKAESVYTNGGYRRVKPAQCEVRYTVETRELDRDTLEVLSYIMCSPCAAVANDGEEELLQDIDILTDDCRTYSDGELSTLQISFRYRYRK